MQPIPFFPWNWRETWWQTSDRRDEDAAAADERPDTGLIGYDVEATDGSIGSVDQDNARVPSDCMMVDTGPWIFGKKVILPVGTVQNVDHEQRKVYVDRSKDEVKAAPEYDPATFDSDAYRQKLGDYYTESYRTTPPM